MYTKSIQLKEIVQHQSGSDIDHYVGLKTQWHICENRNLVVSPLIEDKFTPLGIEISHSALTTQLDFTGVTPYEILLFDSEKQFMGKTFSLHEGSGTFRIETQARFILIWNTKEDEKTRRELQNFNCKTLLLDDDLVFTINKLSGYYGKFPYFILKHPKSPCYTQIPIHLVEDESSADHLPGSVLSITSEILEDKDKKESLLLYHFEKVYEKISVESNRPKDLALVLSSDSAYYLPKVNNKPRFLNSIPYGGVLLDLNGHIIAQSIQHFI
ncbi:hypothetical protein RCH18_002487 [Flavobacterium sp. PL11]|uniref:hypothetical protein n=1 Tax=Flavobacterium sp. PL11 TaxID=3071717 RepID=UPI002DFB84E9|nr:hypothetical protein [Flavobacterium sp. PL11]